MVVVALKTASCVAPILPSTSGCWWSALFPAEVVIVCFPELQANVKTCDELVAQVVSSRWQRARRDPDLRSCVVPWCLWREIDPVNQGLRRAGTGRETEGDRKRKQMREQEKC